MKTTIDIPDALYRQAKIRAIERGGSLRDLVLAALRRELEVAGRAAEEGPPRAYADMYELDENGFAVLRRAKDDDRVVTNAWVNDMRESMGI